MKISILFTLLISFAVFAKPNIDYKYIPKDANLVGYVSTKTLMNNKFFKKFSKSKDGRESIAQLKKMGINIKKLGSAFFYSNSDKILESKNPEKNMKDVDFAIIFKGVTFEKFIKNLAKGKKDAKIVSYNGATIYHDLSVNEDDSQDTLKAISFLKGNSILGSFSGVQKVIDASKGKSSFAEKKLVDNMFAAFKNPHVFIVNVINSKQKVLMNKALQKNRTNPIVAMLGIPALSKTAKSFGFSLKLKGNNVIIQVAIQADKASVKPFITGLNTQYTQFKPMIMQQISVYATMLGKLGVKELKSILNSLKIVQKNDLALISIKVNLNNAVKIMDQMDKQKGQDNEKMMKMMQKQQPKK